MRILKMCNNFTIIVKELSELNIVHWLVFMYAYFYHINPSEILRKTVLIRQPFFTQNKCAFVLYTLQDESYEPSQDPGQINVILIIAYKQWSQYINYKCT